MAAAEEKFPWDHEKPKTAFWNEIGWKESRSFFQAFPGNKQAEPALQPKLAGALDLPYNDKLQILLDILEERLRNEETRAATATPPKVFRDHDYNAWRNVWHDIRTMKSHQGRHEEEEQIMLMLMEAQPPDDKNNLSEHHFMCFKLVEKGQYEEAEAMATEVLEWLESHPMCGPSSPQALSMRRLLVKKAWKKGTSDMAKDRISKLRASVDGLPMGKFAKYTKDEKQMLNGLVAEITD